MVNQVKKISKSYLKYVRSLKNKKYRYKNKSFVVEGEKLFFELKQSSYDVEKYIVTEDFFQKEPIEASKTFLATHEEMRQISNLSSSTNFLAVVKMKNQTQFKNQNKILLLDNLKDPGNLGSILRSSQWFGIDFIALSENCVDIFNPKVVHSSMGSILYVNFSYVNLINFIKSLKKIPTIVTTLNGKTISKTVRFKKFALIVGNESNGVSKNLVKYADFNFKLQKFSEKIDSLNVASATSIFLYSFTD